MTQAYVLQVNEMISLDFFFFKQVCQGKMCSSGRVGQV